MTRQWIKNTLFFSALCLLLALTRQVDGAFFQSNSPNDQATKYDVTGRVFVSEAGKSIQSAFGQFQRVAGRLAVQEYLHRTETEGQIQVEMRSWRGENALMDSQVKRHLLQTARYPTANLNIERLDGLNSDNIKPGKTGKGLLVGTFEIQGEQHAVNIPIRLYHFTEGVWGVEPVGPLALSLDLLGLQEERSLFHQVIKRSFDDQIHLVFRLELQRLKERQSSLSYSQ